MSLYSPLLLTVGCTLLTFVHLLLGWLDPSWNLKGPRPLVRQPPYMFGTTQVEVYLKLNSVYYIVPSLYNRKQRGAYCTIKCSAVQCTNSVFNTL
jgi:hypothetical protein